ncbi:MAG: hypothetical protein P4L40_08465 [Terracidiphilus sp.]|nr:hypothetical protein [Terracidiphilus sp.]
MPVCVCVCVCVCVLLLLVHLAPTSLLSLAHVISSPTVSAPTCALPPLCVCVSSFPLQTGPGCQRHPGQCGP